MGQSQSLIESQYDYSKNFFGFRHVPFWYLCKKGNNLREKGAKKKETICVKSVRNIVDRFKLFENR